MSLSNTTSKSNVLFLQRDKIHITDIIALEYSKDIFAFARGDGTILFAGEKGIDNEIKAHEESLLAATSFKDGLVTCSDDGKIIVTDIKGKTTLLLKEPGRFFDQIASANWGGIAASDGRIIMVLMPEMTVKTYKAEGCVGGLSFTPSGRKLAASRNGGASIYWVGTERAKPDDYVWQGAHGPITISPNGDFLVTSMQENALHIWRIDHTKHGRMGGYPTRIKALSWEKKGRFLATSGADELIIWPFHTKDGPIGQAAQQIPIRQEDFLTAVSWHPKSDFIATGSENGFLHLAQQNGEAHLLIDNLGSPVTALKWSKQGRYLAFGCDEGTFGLIDCETYF